MEEFYKYLNNNEIIRKINDFVLEKVSDDNSLIKKDYYDNHIIICTYYAYLMAKELNGDIEVAVIASLLHDYARYNLDWCERHEYYSGQEASKILSKLGYPLNKIDIIKESILYHRTGMKKFINKQIQIVADADYISYIKKIDYFKKYEFDRFDKNTAQLHIRLKLLDIFAKISEYGKAFIIDDVNKILENMEEWKWEN